MNQRIRRWFRSAWSLSLLSAVMFVAVSIGCEKQTSVVPDANKLMSEWGAFAAENPELADEEAINAELKRQQQENTQNTPR